jgi:hypothetical protein
MKRFALAIAVLFSCVCSGQSLRRAVPPRWTETNASLVFSSKDFDRYEYYFQYQSENPIDITKTFIPFVPDRSVRYAFQLCVRFYDGEGKSISSKLCSPYDVRKGKQPDHNWLSTVVQLPKGLYYVGLSLTHYGNMEAFTPNIFPSTRRTVFRHSNISLSCVKLNDPVPCSDRNYPKVTVRYMPVNDAARLPEKIETVGLPCASPKMGEFDAAATAVVPKIIFEVSENQSAN